MLGLVVALAAVVAPGAVGWLVAHVPGAGLVRDVTRFVALRSWVFMPSTDRAGMPCPSKGISGPVAAEQVVRVDPLLGHDGRGQR